MGNTEVIQRALEQQLEQSKNLINWELASAPAKAWWEKLESVNEDRIELILELTDELINRHASLEDFYLVCLHSGRRGVRENLNYFDLLHQDSAVSAVALDTEIESKSEIFH